MPTVQDVPHLPLGPDEALHVLVPSRALGEAVEALSPRVRAYRVNADDGPVSGDATLAQVWVPRSGGASVPDNGFLESLPRLRLLPILHARAGELLGRPPPGGGRGQAGGGRPPPAAGGGGGGP